MPECELFGTFGLLVQGFIAAFCFFTLFTIWRCETPRRNFLTWVFDVTKQLTGASWAHILNVCQAQVFSTLPTERTGNNACIFYLISFMFDVIVNTFLCWQLHRLVRPLLLRRCSIEIGEYEKEEEKNSILDDSPSVGPSASKWRQMILQTAIWLGIISSVRIIAVPILYFGQGFMYRIYDWLFDVCMLDGHPRRELIVSIILIPMGCDVLQFAFVDSILKKPRGEEQTDSELWETTDDDSADGEE
eukprot:gnl/TRDRNA2_/TRDRNA2_139820_c0_seq1.p1 gnl/TRDRNA2_/TRDRNA2_139820_c0~~gnl/TRDRNA2_/TRDRNA2_139820_c0_seq1.p1  ORF type:complete len:246 (-),score=26.11 gnl/TRDRNA2_/TRDRNA2_139820_c0_seq1:86-823(-)